MDIDKLIEKKATFSKGTNFHCIFSKIEFKFLAEELISLNKKGMSVTYISKSMGIGRTNLRRLFKDFNHVVLNRQNQLRVRETLFSSITTEEDAYWLGFIYADGYISKEGKFELSLNYKDFSHLLKFAEFCDFAKNKVIEKQKVGVYYRCRISFATKFLQKQFYELGVIPNKSLILTYPSFLTEELHRHFIRGYFDGDGCMYIRKPRTNNNIKREITVSILGTKSFLENLNLNSGITIKNVVKRKNIYVLTFSCKEARKFLKYIYTDSITYLDRKFNKYQHEIAPLFSDE